MKKYFEIQKIMDIKTITILSLLFIFGIVNQVEADPFGRLDGSFYQERLSDGKKFSVKSIIDSLRENQELKLIESIERLFSLSKIGEAMWRYNFLDPKGVEETRSFRSDFSSSILRGAPNTNRYIEGGAQGIFELMQSKLKRTELFISLHLSFNPKGDQILLEMHLTPSSNRGVNFFIPF